MIGAGLGHYRITAMIGAGGMGVVYRAHDERLERDVAVKVLPPGIIADETARKRLRAEAMTLSRLNHPNVATVHDFDNQDGVDFLVMEMIPGATLDQRIMGDPLPERDVLRLGIQLAQGLAAAHAEGIVHRDLKPGNVRITPDGRLKILDFGLAMLRRPDCDENADTAAIGDNMVAGSPPYMAPEQLLGEPVDARTDIYAAGAVIYEMATGRRPFADVHGARLIDSILHQPPAAPFQLNPRVSAGLEQIVLKCLDKEPQRRYQTARELLVDLERLSIPSAVTQPSRRAARTQVGWTVLAGVAVLSVLVGSHASGARVARTADAAVAPGPIRSIAVLPLANLSGDPGQEYFADGMTDALIADLGRSSSVRVISRTSSMQYKEARRPLPVIARELGVDAVVEGSVVRTGERVRINAQLVHAESDRRLWGESYDRALGDVLVLQAEVAAAIAREVNAKLQTPEPVVAGPVDPVAHEAYLRGRHLFQRMDEPSLRRALEYFEQAVARDPSHARAYAGIADTRLLLHYTLARGFQTPPAEAFQQVEAAASRALRIDPSLAEAQCALALSYMNLKWDWAAAERWFGSALKANGSLSDCREEHAWFLASQGRLEQALAEMTKARELDPLSLPVSTGVGAILMYRGQTDQAITQLRSALELNRDFVVAHYGLGRAYLVQGRTQDAIASLRTALSLSPERPEILADLAHAYARAGRRQDALDVMARWRKATRGGEFTRDEQAAHMYLALGEREKAYALLEKAYEHHSPGMVWLKVDPRFDALRGDARFQRLLRRMGLV